MNDGEAEIDGIARLLAGRYAIMNLIPYNRIDDLPYRRPEAQRCEHMAAALRRRGIVTTLRQSAAQSVDGGCGQLRARDSAGTSVGAGAAAPAQRLSSRPDPLLERPCSDLTSRSKACTSASRARLPGQFGLIVTELGEGRLAARFELQDWMLAPNGYLHAASIITLADTCAGYACMAHLPDGAKGFTTIELKSNFLGTALAGTIHCVAEAEHLGRTTQVWSALVRGPAEQGGRKLALFRCTQMVLW